MNQDNLNELENEIADEYDIAPEGIPFERGMEPTEVYLRLWGEIARLRERVDELEELIDNE